MSTELNDQLDAELADRLRLTFATMMPLLDDPGASRATAPVSVSSGVDDWPDEGVSIDNAPDASVPVVRSQRSRLLVTAASAVLLVGAVVAIAARPDAPPAAEPVPAGFTPPGDEYPLTEVALASLAPTDLPAGLGRIARPGSVRAATSVGLDGWTMAYDAIGYAEFSGTVHRFRCEEQLGAAMCVPAEATSATLGSQHGERERWTSVPDEAAWVGYVDGDGRAYWQRPVGPIAVFPSTTDAGVFTAYDSNGNLIETHERSAGAVDDPYSQTTDTLTADQREVLHAMTVDVLRDCLDTAGATYPYGEFFPELPAASPPDTWDRCVAATKHAVDQQFVDWAARVLPLTVAEPGSPITPDVVERGMPAATVILAGTEPTCTTADSEVFDCTLTSPPFWDGDPNDTASDTASDWDYTSMAQTFVDDNSRVAGGCRAQDATGMHWICYAGRRAIAEQLVGEEYLGQVSTGPGRG